MHSSKICSSVHGPDVNALICRFLIVFIRFHKQLCTCRMRSLAYFPYLPRPALQGITAAPPAPCPGAAADTRVAKWSKTSRNSPRRWSLASQAHDGSATGRVIDCQISNCQSPTMKLVGRGTHSKKNGSGSPPHSPILQAPMAGHGKTDNNPKLLGGFNPGLSATAPWTLGDGAWARSEFQGNRPRKHSNSITRVIYIATFIQKHPNGLVIHLKKTIGR